ncbi:MAG: ferritin-like domain-containing protein [Alphaproteobacteria bacterium]|nr:ferritin-like domain-containing protein [Alphaproteobacteria bacterium]MCB9796250.1 ferritin-like domain-containing protein [Alphaproteobacteria bacterium]
MSPALRALRLSLLASIALAPACIGGDDDKVDSLADDSTSTGSLCEDPVSIAQTDGSASGFERCADGTVNRPAALTADATVNAPSCAGTEDYQDCNSDADCTDGPNAKCISATYDFSGESYCGCVYACETDADCDPGQICLADGVIETGRDWASCVTAECATNADCESGECGLTAFDDGCGPVPELACRGDDDPCRLDSDCATANEECGLVSGEWGCREDNCDIGRPLLIDGRARTAPAAARGDWSAALSPVLPRDRALRLRLAAHWTEVAALEHASVASFARFTLQLMALGAPPELLAEAQVAAADEVRHAQLAFGLASAYADAPVGPGPLALEDLRVETDHAEVVRALVAEACVGETLGVAEALAAARLCEDPEVKRHLTQVVEDERRHAALAWRTLRWLLAHDASLVAVAQAAAESALAEHLAPLPDEPGARAHGLLSAELRDAVRREAAETVVRPCLAAAAGARLAA